MGESRSVSVDFQVACQVDSIPMKAEVHSWLEQAFQASSRNTLRRCEVAVRIVDEEESRKLNKQFRQQDKATNVLAFGAGSPDGITGLPEDEVQALGDLVICGPLVEEEAQEQGKSPASHWGHLLVHGMLHLQGFDHALDAETKNMEALEVEILSSLGYINPYNS